MRIASARSPGPEPPVRRSAPLPARPCAWYLVCASSALPPGRVTSWSLPGRPFVVYRGRRDGKVHAVAAHCPHMGTHLRSGEVIGDCLRCPLHHWQFDETGRCRHIPQTDTEPSGIRLQTFPTAERYGAIFLFNGPEVLYDPPFFACATEDEIRLRAGKDVALDCSWHAIAANGFDIRHFQTVHQRALHSEPRFDRLDDHRIQLCYASRVTGRAPSDRLMQWLSRDRIQVRITCHGGPVMTVESDLGRARSTLLLSLRPTVRGVTVTPLFGVYRSRNRLWDHTRLLLARWLFGAFLSRDVAIMDSMRFHLSGAEPVDRVLESFVQFLAELPEG